MNQNTVSMERNTLKENYYVSPLDNGISMKNR